MSSNRVYNVNLNFGNTLPRDVKLKTSFKMHLCIWNFCLLNSCIYLDLPICGRFAMIWYKIKDPIGHGNNKLDTGKASRLQKG